MRYASVCSGIEAASVAWHPLGWEPAFFSEIDPFACSVLKHHYPDVPNLGTLSGLAERIHDASTVDALVGGTPCQSFSLAGLRGGLGDDRGNLAHEFLRLASRINARWLVWENVSGVLSSNRGRDFGAILGGMEELGYSVAWRILDAQYCRSHSHSRAVPQRRRRLFACGYLGDWRPPAAVLLERESLSRTDPPGRRSRETPAETGSPGSREEIVSLIGSGRWTVAHDVIPTMTAADIPIVLQDGVLRQITPLEAARAFGFPDTYLSAVMHGGKPLSKSQQYRLLGNSMCVNVMQWIGQRIDMVERVIRRLHEKNHA